MQRKKSVRQAAALVLTAVFENGARSDLELSAAIRSCGAEKKDAALLSSMVYGVVQNYRRLDNIISAYSKRPIGKISDNILNILRCAVYQNEYMDRIPDYALVNEAVSAAHALSNKGAASFVNGILRAYISSKAKVETPDFSDEWERLSFEYSLSTDIISVWRESYGDETARKLSECSNDKLPSVIRINTLSGDPQAIVNEIKSDLPELTKTWPENAYEAVFSGSPADLDGFRKGAFTLQDKGAQLAVEAMRLKPGERVLDLCCAPGGKSVAAAAIMDNKGEIFGFDVSEDKKKLIDEYSKRCKADILNSGVNDASRFREDFAEKFDAVICDVPCSGLGTIQQKPDVRLKKRRDMDELVPLQMKILENAAKYVKHGGRILYSTCTLNRRENEDIVEKFLSENGEFFKMGLSDICLRYSVDGEKDGMLTLMPHINGCGGFFICMLERK